MSRCAITLYDSRGGLRTLEQIEGDIIRIAIKVHNGKMTDVAKALGIGRSTLYRKLADHGIGVSGHRK